MPKGPDTVNVGLLWHSVNSDNLGVGALTASHIAIVEKVADDLNVDVRFKILGWSDREPAYIDSHNIDVVRLRARDIVLPNGLYAAVRGCDLILDISAGDSFADIYGSRRFVLNALGKLAVLMARKPLILSPQTIGPYQRWWARLIAHRLMRAARRVVTRDALSSAYLRTLGLEDKLVEATDVAFRLPYDSPPRRSAPLARVGVNVSGLLYNGGYTQDNMFSLAADYPALVHAILEHFSALPDCELHLIGHVNSKTHEVEDDYRVAERLAALFPGTVLAPRFESPSAAKSYIATMDFFCGSRMHACIAAFSSGVPVLPIAYSRKFAGLFNTLGYDRVSDCRTQSAENILDAVIKAFDQRELLLAEVAAGRTAAEAKLEAYEAVLLDILREVGCPAQ